MGTLPSQPAQVLTSASTTVATDLAAGSDAGAKAPEYIGMPKGQELNEMEAIDLARSRPVQWVVLAGPTDAGKTTLLTSLYELFQWREVQEYAFAGSMTLPGLEERCYLSRIESGNRLPKTQRTPYVRPDPLYLHLRIRSTKGLRPFRDILCTDVSGEMFEHARDSTDECKKMTFLKRAHHFLLFLDSAKAVQPDKRWAMIEEGRALLRSCVDSEMIGASCVVNFVWSRFDYFAAAEAETGHRVFRTEAEKQLRKSFHGALPTLMFSEVAARPLKFPQLQMGHGVPALFQQWAETPLKMQALGLFPRSFSGARESELFAARHFASTTANEDSNG